MNWIEELVYISALIAVVGLYVSFVVYVVH